MEENWKYTKPFSYPMKGFYGHFNYGFRPKKRKPGYKCQKRKVLREIRHYGFDTSECWELATVIMWYLSDTVGGYFRECGDADEWYMTDIEGNEYPDGVHTSETFQLYVNAEDLRKEDYKKHLEEYLATGGKYQEFLDFVIPRLIYFTKHHQGYPGNFSSEEEWTEILKTMIEDLFKCDTKLFIKYFFNLWD